LGRSRQIVEHYVGDIRYLSKRNFLKSGSVFGMDFIFNEVPNKHIFFDWDVFDAVDVQYYAGAVCLEDGKTHWFAKGDVTRDLKCIVASCSIPYIARIVEINGRHYLDGGITDAMPVEKAERENEFCVVVSTHNAGFVRQEKNLTFLSKVMYGKYPAFVEALRMQNEVYNHQVQKSLALQEEGRAYIVRPMLPLEVTRTTRDTTKLLRLYDEGIAEGKKAVQFLKERFHQLWAPQ